MTEAAESGDAAVDTGAEGADLDTGQPEGGQPEGGGEAGDQPQGYDFTAWGENWREGFIEEGNESQANVMNRLKSPQDVVKKLWNQEKMIRSGEAKQVPGEGSSDEEWAAYREANGIPADPGAYEFNLEFDPDVDAPYIEAIAPALHELNLNNEQAGKIAAAFVEARKQSFESVKERDHLAATNAQRQLKEHYGPDYQQNLNAANRLMEDIPEDFRDDIRNARLPDGTPLMSSVHFVDRLVDWGRMMYPEMTIMPGSSDPGAALADRIDELKAKRSENRREWDKDPRNQEEMMRLLTQQEQLDKARKRA